MRKKSETNWMLKYNHPDKKREYGREYYKKNIDKVRKYEKINSKKIKQRQSEYRNKNRDIINRKARKSYREYRKEYYQKYFHIPEVKIRVRNHSKKYYKKNKDKILAKHREYYKRNRLKLRTK